MVHELTGTVLLPDGSDFVGTLRITPLSYPTPTAAAVIAGAQISVVIDANDNGAFAVDLEPGDYRATWRVNDIANTAYFTMPDDDASFNDIVDVDETFPIQVWRYFDRTLKSWTLGGAYSTTAATNNANGVCTSATVLWPDDSTGTFTATSVNSTYHVCDAYTITHANSGKTVTQAAVTRDSNGAITVQPAIVISPEGDVASADMAYIVGGIQHHATLTAFRAATGGEKFVWLEADADGRGGMWYRDGSGTDDGVNYVVRTDLVVYRRLL